MDETSVAKSCRSWHACECHSNDIDLGNEVLHNLFVTEQVCLSVATFYATRRRKSAKGEQANIQISTSLPRPGLLALCILKAQ